VLAQAHQNQKRDLSLEQNTKADKVKKRSKPPNVMHIRRIKDNCWVAFYRGRNDIFVRGKNAAEAERKAERKLKKGIKHD